MSAPLDVRRVIEKLFKVELKEARDGEKIVDFILNRSQKELDASAVGHRKHVVLKARQLGVSTYILARFLVKCLMVPGTHAVIISHERQATIKLLRKVKFFVDELRRAGIAVNTDYDSKSEMTFPDSNSSLYIGTAGQKAFSRGETVTDVHASEVAFWENADELMRGVMGALTPTAEIFLESTANGAGGYFYTVCQKAMAAHPTWKKFSNLKGVTESDWLFHFYPWTDEPLYSIPVPANVPFWTEEERALHENGLPWTRVYWRRKKLGDYNSVEDFLAEFPLTPDEAFIVTGACYFDKKTLRLYTRLTKEPTVKGAVEMVGQRAQFNRFSDKAPLSIWEHPKPGMEYLITADCSEGLDDPESDDAVAQVLNRTTLKQAAVLEGKIDPSDMGVYLYALGAYFGWPWVAVEDNGPGLVALFKLKELGYPRIFSRKALDVNEGREVDKLGWGTDMRTRTPMLSEFRRVIKHQLYHMVDERLLKQCTTFCRQKDGGYRANSGCHDDHVMSAAIGVFIHGHIPMDAPMGDSRDTLYRGGQPAQEFNHGGSSKTGY